MSEDEIDLAGIVNGRQKVSELKGPEYTVIQGIKFYGLRD